MSNSNYLWFSIFACFRWPDGSWVIQRGNSSRFATSIKHHNYWDVGRLSSFPLALFLQTSPARNGVAFLHSNSERLVSFLSDEMQIEFRVDFFNRLLSINIFCSWRMVSLEKNGVILHFLLFTIYFWRKEKDGGRGRWRHFSLTFSFLWRKVWWPIVWEFFQMAPTSFCCILLVNVPRPFMDMQLYLQHLLLWFPPPRLTKKWTHFFIPQEKKFRCHNICHKDFHSNVGKKKKKKDM